MTTTTSKDDGIDDKDDPNDVEKPPGFETLNLNPALLKAVEELGFQHPTPIQTKAIPPVLDGRDLIGCAQTGTGKTAAFLLPVMHRLMAGQKGGTRVLVLEPTRELAAQVEEDFRDLGKHSHLKCATVYGGVGFGNQTTALRQGFDIIVATPGRLLDHMERGNARFDRLTVLVLDEADRMMDMGFIPDLRRILQKLPKVRQTLFFSATMPPEIERLSREMLKDPVKIDVGRRPTPATGITAAVYPVAQNRKTALLTLLLRSPNMNSVLVFARTKHRAERLGEQLQSRGFSVAIIHGNRSQGQREQALDAFKAGQAMVMVATDIAARGLDIQDISHVINYDVPNTAEDYVHRIGRTGRAQAVGDAFTLVAYEEEAAMSEIEKSLGTTLPRVTRPDFDYGLYVPLPPPPPQPTAVPPSQGMHSNRKPSARRRRL
ncbi:MAG TPA: DEAD/DEAH box helicase [Planctomycetota bacterium]|nr:DEAD/DEAH box helicase [Planctomycetota bacterium]